MKGDQIERAAAARARRRAAQRAARVAEGAAELDRRLADALRRGLAGGGPPWAELAARMVDAQAPGLAARARALAEPGAGDSGPGALSRLLEECALLHLLAAGYGRVEALPAPLAATVRARVGFTAEAAAILATGPRVRDTWRVLGRREGVEERLSARRVWLRGASSGQQALLLGFTGPAGSTAAAATPSPASGPVDGLRAGAALDAELAYYPGALPLRAVLDPAGACPAGDGPAGDGPAGDGPAGGSPAAAPEGCSLAEGVARYGSGLAADPWLESWPVVLAGAIPVPGPGSGGRGWRLADAATGESVPFDPRHAVASGLWRLAAVSGGRPLTVFGELGHRGFAAVTAWPPEDPGAPVDVTD